MVIIDSLVWASVGIEGFDLKRDFEEALSFV